MCPAASEAPESHTSLQRTRINCSNGIIAVKSLLLVVQLGWLPGQTDSSTHTVSFPLPTLSPDASENARIELWLPAGEAAQIPRFKPTCKTSRFAGSVF